MNLKIIEDRRFSEFEIAGKLRKISYFNSRIISIRQENETRINQ